jgi:hypothetical protein
MNNKLIALLMSSTKFMIIKTDLVSKNLRINYILALLLLEFFIIMFIKIKIFNYFIEEILFKQI